jgi:hypothetical protein
MRGLPAHHVNTTLFILISALCADARLLRHHLHAPKDGCANVQPNVLHDV